MQYILKDWGKIKVTLNVFISLKLRTEISTFSNNDCGN